MEKRSKKVTIISRESDKRTLDIAMLEEELLRRGISVRVMSRLLTKDSVAKAAGYLGHVIAQEAAILSSDVVVLDTYCIPASMLPHRSGTKVVQMWHALSAIKKFGWQTVGREGGSSETVARLMRMHRGYDYVACASDITAKYFCEAFRTGPDKIVKYGLPRIDYIKSVACGSRREDTATHIYARYPQLKKGHVILSEQSESKDHKTLREDNSPVILSERSEPKNLITPQNDRADKKTVLYAPTFRMGKAVDVQSLIDALDPDKYNLVIKLHPLYRVDTDPESREAEQKDSGLAKLDTRSNSVRTATSREEILRRDVSSNVIYDDDFTSFDWLSVADIIISDYSSLVVEATLADKPLYIYAYDLDDYDRSTGLNIDFESEPIAPYVFRDAKKLAACIDRNSSAADDKSSIADNNEGYDLEALRAFRDRYIDIDTGADTAKNTDTDTDTAANTDAGIDTGGGITGASENYVTARLADFIESLC